MYKRKLIICALSGFACIVSFLLFLGLAFALALVEKGNEIPYSLALVSLITGAISMRLKGNEN